VTFAQKVAKANGLGDWFVNQIKQESGFNPAAASGAGAQGIAQIVPKWHPDAPAASDPYGQLDWAGKYMSSLVNQYGGSVPKALSVYNSGKPDAYLDPNFANGQTYNYVKDILGTATKTRGNVVSKPPSSTLGGVPQTQSVLPDLSQAVFQSLGKSPSMGLSNLANFVASQPPPGMVGKSPSSSVLRTPSQTGLGVTIDHGGQISANAPAVVKLADHYMGEPYKWGGANPKTGFDCSGFVQWLYRQQGINLPRTTYEQIQVGQPVARKNLEPGDIVFFSKQGDVHHEGLYIGDGQFIHAPHTGDVVKISSLSDPYYKSQFAGGRRVAVQ
jgi:hypothetical protein